MNLSFYKAVLPPQGEYCAVAITTGDTVRQTFHSTIEEMVARAAEITSSHSHAYFALAAFNESGSRVAKNVRALKSFFLDLDCGADKAASNKGYVDQAAAAVALRQFILDTGIPEPFVVNSGRGLHAYWAIEEEMPYTVWKPLAEAFKKLCIGQRLLIDPAVPGDAARVLRMVDTLNFKTEPPSPVVLMNNGDIVPLARFKQCLPEPPVDLSLAKMYGMDEATRNAAGGNDYPASEFARIVRKSVKGTGCAQINHAVREAATLEEPLWRAALSIAWRCTDASKAIHTLSRAHPEYTPEATISKAEGTQGPMTCEWYRLNYGSKCEGCTQSCTSPIALGRKVEAAAAVDNVYKVEHTLNPETEETATVQVEIPVYPYPYFRGANGGVFRHDTDPSGEPMEMEIYPHDLYITSRFYDSEEHGDGEGAKVGVNLHTPHDGIRRFYAPVSTILVKEKMRDILLRHEVVAINKQLDNLMGYFASSIKNLVSQSSAARTRNQMGWTPDMQGFVIGELEYTDKGIRLAPASSATKELAPKMHFKGSLEAWTKIANVYNMPGHEAHALALFFGFGAPLLRLKGAIDVRGAVINLLSNKAGTGKTTAQMMINSIFGHPNELLLKETDTKMSKEQWLGMMNTVAITMDEVTNMPDQDVSELVYNVPQGRGKHRMESQTNKLRANVLSWDTFAITSSNSSLYDKLLRNKSTSDGELRRLIELNMARSTTFSKEDADLIFGELSYNYGLAGPVFIQYVLTHKDEVIAKIKQIQGRLDKDLGMDQSDRFYSTVLACAFAGAAVASKLGLFTIDIPRIYTYAVQTIGGIRREVIAPVTDAPNVAQEALTTYINENLMNTLVINAKGVNGIPPAATFLPRGPLRMRFEPDTRELWIPVSAVRDYFVERQIDVRSALKALSATGLFKHNGDPQAKRFSAGAVGNFDAPSTRCYCIDGAYIGLDPDSFTLPT